MARLRSTVFSRIWVRVARAEARLARLQKLQCAVTVGFHGAVGFGKDGECANREVDRAKRPVPGRVHLADGQVADAHAKLG